MGEENNKCQAASCSASHVKFCSQLTGNVVGNLVNLSVSRGGVEFDDYDEGNLRNDVLFLKFLYYTIE